MVITRRNILKGMAVAPIGGSIAAEHLKMRMMISGLAGAGVASPAYMSNSEEPSKFVNFLSWLKAGGGSEMRLEADRIDGLDADIIEMVSPSFVIKVIMQRKRNYQRLLSEKQDWFKRTLARQGVVTAWF